LQGYFDSPVLRVAATLKIDANGNKTVIPGPDFLVVDSSDGGDVVGYRRFAYRTTAGPYASKDELLAFGRAVGLTGDPDHFQADNLVLNFVPSGTIFVEDVKEIDQNVRQAGFISNILYYSNNLGLLAGSGPGLKYSYSDGVPNLNDLNSDGAPGIGK